MARADRTAMPNNLQDAPYILKFVGVIPSPEAKMLFLDLLGQIQEDILPYCTGSCYLNFLSGEAKWQSAATVFPAEALARLSALKRTYDPDNLLSYSINLTGAAH